jgi:4a-hydroxytetrahydrobiopterin dehydratase
MTSLHQQDCNEIGADLAALDDSSISSRLSELSPVWTYDAGEHVICHTYSFSNYYQTMAFANVVAQIAHQQDHHPQMVIEYKTCTVMYSTHSVSGISIKDFICAAKINQALTL